MTSEFFPQDLSKELSNPGPVDSEMSLAGLCPESQNVVDFFVKNGPIYDPQVYATGAQALDALERLYNQSVQDLQDAIVSPELLKTLKEDKKGTYPYLGIFGKGAAKICEASRAWGILRQDGYYGVTVTQPDLFRDYLQDQLASLEDLHDIIFVVGRSARFIPIHFLKEDLLSQVSDFSQIHHLVTMPSLKDIDDHVANGLIDWEHIPVKPLSYFSAERTDYSLARIQHYCGTRGAYFQRFILLTNYQRYVDLFFNYAQQALNDPDSGYDTWVEPQDQVFRKENLADSKLRESSYPFQMPAYHLTRPDGNGITLINIGVGPSNAKNITDHLAVLRPHCWLMLGHCAGLRQSQRLGDYVLAHGYMRDDHVLNEELSPDIPLPPIQVMQEALYDAIQKVCGFDAETLQSRVRCGTVVSTGNRNWELHVEQKAKTFHKCRALALDMESAVVAANGFRFRVPYATLLCVSDRPLHGEIKLRSMAQQFYQQRVEAHLRIGVQTMEALRVLGQDKLHTPELRSFQDVPFR
jgi:AMP nucleosidase